MFIFSSHRCHFPLKRTPITLIDVYFLAPEKESYPYKCDIINPAIITIDAYKVLQQFAELVHHLLLMLHERVNVAVEGYGRVLVTEYFGECFNIHSAFQGASCKGVPERMKALVRYFKLLLQRSKGALVRSD